MNPAIFSAMNTGWRVWKRLSKMYDAEGRKVVFTKFARYAKDGKVSLEEWDQIGYDLGIVDPDAS